MVTDPRPPVIDALLPPDMAVKAESVGAAKAAQPADKLFMLAVLAGAFIGFGAVISTVAVTGAGDLAYGIARLVAGITFSLGLVLVVIGGAELFTGDNLIVMAWAAKRITLRQVLRLWVIVYLGNLVGSVGLASMVFLSGHYRFAGGEVGLVMMRIAEAKASLGMSEAFFLGILCNVLVCLAVWMCFSARTVTGKVAVIVPPIAAFVAAGFEHSVANMYFFAIGGLVRWHATPEFLAGIGSGTFDAITFSNIAANLATVTAGNVVGGVLLVALVYWFVYLRGRESG